MFTIIHECGNVLVHVIWVGVGVVHSSVTASLAMCVDCVCITTVQTLCYENYLPSHATFSLSPLHYNIYIFISILL